MMKSKRETSKAENLNCCFFSSLVFQEGGWQSAKIESCPMCQILLDLRLLLRRLKLTSFVSFKVLVLGQPMFFQDNAFAASCLCQKTKDSSNRSKRNKKYRIFLSMSHGTLKHFQTQCIGSVTINDLEMRTNNEFCTTVESRFITQVQCQKQDFEKGGIFLWNRNPIFSCSTYHG